MRRGLLELFVGTGLLLGPLAYALTLEPRVEVVEIAPVPVAQPAPLIPAPVIPDIQPAAEPELQGPVLDLDEAAPLELLPFAFVTTAGLVLDTHPDAEWSTGSLRKHAGPGQFRAGKRVNASKVPTAPWSLRGRTFDLYGAEGKVCSARLGDLTVVAQHDGPTAYDLFAPSDGPELDYDGFEANPPTAPKMRARVWNHPEATRWLVAEVLGDRSCEGAIWARDAELPAPEILRRSGETTDLTRRRVAELQASEEYAQTRTAYEAFRAELDDDGRQYFGPWSQIEAEYPAKVQTWRDEAGEPRFIELDFGADEEGCGEGFYTRITAMQAVVDGALVDIERTIEPLTLFDADLDGSYEMLYRSEEDNGMLVRSETAVLEQRVSIAQEWVCPC